MSTKIAKPVRRLLDRAQKRFVRSRSGSVLILVVALLVLMALIGTAFMTMAQFDRASAVQHSFNTEVDLLLDGVLNQVKGTITNDIFSSGTFRPAVTISASNNQPVYYNTPQMPAAPRYWNGLGYDNATANALNAQAGDPWLASRVPGLPVENAEPSTTSSPANVPWWPFISAPINGSTTFDQPYWPPSNAVPPQPPVLSQRSELYPTSYTGGDGLVWPGFTTSSASGATVFMAADADGDGIADSGLVKLLTLDGITYYAAVRIVDNCAAVNPSIAETPNPFATYQAPNASGNGYIPGDLSPVNVDLEGMTVNPGPTGSATPSTYLKWSAPADLYASLPPKGPAPTFAGQGLLSNFRFNQLNQTQAALNDNGGARLDFLYDPYLYTYPNSGEQLYYYFDQQWMQLGRRLSNPGFITPQTPPASPSVPVNPSLLYQALPISESLAMAKHFILRDPTVVSSTSSPSILEMRMPNTVYQSPYAGKTIVSGLGVTPQYGYPTTPYKPTDTYNWFLQNFDYWYDFDSARSSPTPLTPTMPMRALLAPQNPVSNFAPARFNLYPKPGATYQFGDVQTYKGSKYVCIRPNLPVSSIPLALDRNWSDPNWAWEPWTNAPTKTSVNTGTFQQLYAAYWAVMADQYVPGTSTTNGQWFPAYFGANSSNPTSLTNPTNSTYGRMFRDPIRFNNTTPPTTNVPGTSPVLSSQQVMMLRASLAAVNTMALRQGDAALLSQYGTNDVISRTVYLPAMLKGDSDFQAQVYGVERQPYITQVFAINDKNQQNAWMAVELYNPYPDDIKMNNWVLATLDRTTPGTMALTAIGTLQSVGLLDIPSRQRVILVSNATPPTGFTGFPASGAGVNVVTCSGLTSAFGKELILMRPRRADGTPTTGTLANNVYPLESVTLPTDLVPIDSYDFTNIQEPPANATTQEWWYIRPSGLPPEPKAAVNKEWHFVYPGPWMLSASGTTVTPPAGTPPPPTWTGTYSVSPANPAEDLSSFGTPQAIPKAQPLTNYLDTAIQMNNVDFGGPNKPTAGSTSNSLPLGAFPRNGDILQVPFIGSYKLSLTATPTKICEMNPVTADSAMATACESSTDTQQPMVSPTTTVPAVVAENVGRFCPIDPDDAKLTNGAGVNDFAALPAAPAGGPPPTSSPLWRYHWATRIFDFLTVQAPQDDYFPDVDPWVNDQASTTPNLYRYTPAFANGVPQPVANITSGSKNAGLTSPNPIPFPPGTSEDTAPVNGLINVNTAPWRVLSTIPWVPATTTATATDNYRTYNAKIAIGLALYRDGNPLTGVAPHGPFRNLFELGEATISTFTSPTGPPKLRDILFSINPTPPGGMGSSDSYHFPLALGNLTPIKGDDSGGNVIGDFQAVFNTITRISNLVTTRSDSYTAYVLIQGWRNAETPNPQLVVQRRAAVIIDRSAVTPTNRTPNATNVPQ